MRRKIFMSMMMIALVAALVGGATFAYFSDEATNENNTFAAGTLKLGFAPSTWGFDVDNMKPGDRETATLALKNEGSLAIGSVKVDTEVTPTDGADPEDGSNLADALQVEIKYDGTTVFNDKLSKLAPSITLGNVIAFGESKILEVTYEFTETNSDQNEYQGDSLDIDFTFTARQ